MKKKAQGIIVNNIAKLCSHQCFLGLFDLYTPRQMEIIADTLEVILSFTHCSNRNKVIELKQRIKLLRNQ